MPINTYKKAMKELFTTKRHQQQKCKHNQMITQRNVFCCQSPFFAMPLAMLQSSVNDLTCV